MFGYAKYVDDYLKLMKKAASIPLGEYEKPRWPPYLKDGPRVLMFSAHPDDEVMTGMPLCIRLRRAGWQVVNVAMTLGRAEQVERRRAELQAACEHLGIELAILGSREQTLKAKVGDDAYNNTMHAITGHVRRYAPNVVVTHHDDDGHHDHVVTNQTVRSSLQRYGFTGFFVEGEYWKDMKSPNLQLEIGRTDLVVLLEALSCHKGELLRNRYDVFWPPFLHGNARYGEVVTGWGTPAAEFDFSAMYRCTPYAEGVAKKPLEARQIAADQDITTLF